MTIYKKKKKISNYNSINLYGTYDFSLGNHQFKIMAGFNQESSYQETMEALSYGQAVIEVPSLGSGTSLFTDKYNEFSVRGGFFRVNYNIQDNVADVNGRYDGSSFPKDRCQFCLCFGRLEHCRGKIHGKYSELVRFFEATCFLWYDW